MIRKTAVRRWGALMLAGIAALAVPAFAVATISIGAREKLEAGRWQVRDLDNAVAATSVCLGDPAQLVRFGHRGKPGCSSQLLASGEEHATIQYSCRGGGYGHSAVRVETPRSVRIDTQGLSNGRPFSYRLEAQRVGPC
jgi:hypothetical protein